MALTIETIREYCLKKNGVITEEFPFGSEKHEPLTGKNRATVKWVVQELVPQKNVDVIRKDGALVSPGVALLLMTLL